MWGTAAALLVVLIAAWQAPGRVSGWVPRPVATPPDSTVSFAGAQRPITFGDSVVVFAAHPDDEVLGAGGVIHAAVLAGARVRVVIFTNGDAYLKGVDVGFRTLLNIPDRFIQYGMRRQREALAAAARVGLAADRVTFLGYPDRGLAVLWGPGWSCDRLYTSPYTRRDRSPYAIAYRRGVTYCGQHVLDDVESVLRAERPTIVVTHHAGDTHGDHWAAGAFVMAALEQLRAADAVWPRSVHVWSYLVHHGAWPDPKAYAPDLPLTPPADLLRAGGGWSEYPLDRGDKDAKRAAILEYKTQVQLLGAYMLSFARRNELFDTAPPARPALIEGEGLPVAAPEFWDRLPAIVRSTTGDMLVRATEGSATLDSVGLAQDSSWLYIAVRLRQAAIREVQYRVVMTLFYRDGRASRLRLLFRVPRSLTALHVEPQDLSLPLGAAARSFDHRINIALPLAGLGSPVSLLMHVETTGPLRTPVERSPWALVRLEPGRVVEDARSLRPAGATSRGSNVPEESNRVFDGLLQ